MFCHVLLVTRSEPRVSIQKDGDGFPSPSQYPKRGPLREEALWGIPLLIISCWTAQASCPWHARQCEIHLKTPALPRKFQCLIWHHKFLSGARHWMLTLGTAEYQTFMNRSLRSSQLWGAQKIGSCAIAALSVWKIPKNTQLQHLIMNLLTNTFSQKCSVTRAEMFQHLLFFVGNLPERFFWSCLWSCHCKLGLEGARKAA